MINEKSYASDPLRRTMDVFIPWRRIGSFFSSFFSIFIRMDLSIRETIRRPLRLLYYAACLDQADATKRERYLKSYHGKMFLRRRLKSYLTG